MLRRDNLKLLLLSLFGWAFSKPLREPIHHRYVAVWHTWRYRIESGLWEATWTFRPLTTEDEIDLSDDGRGAGYWWQGCTSQEPQDSDMREEAYNIAVRELHKRGVYIVEKRG